MKNCARPSVESTSDENSNIKEMGQGAIPYGLVISSKNCLKNFHAENYYAMLEEEGTQNGPCSRIEKGLKDNSAVPIFQKSERRRTTREIQEIPLNLAGG